jgi:hypothetical protein
MNQRRRMAAYLHMKRAECGYAYKTATRSLKASVQPLRLSVAAPHGRRTPTMSGMPLPVLERASEPEDRVREQSPQPQRGDAPWLTSNPTARLQRGRSSRI